MMKICFGHTRAHETEDFDSPRFFTFLNQSVGTNFDTTYIFCVNRLIEERKKSLIDCVNLFSSSKINFVYLSCRGLDKTHVQGGEMEN